MINKLDIFNKFHDYYDEFREDRSNTIKRLKKLYPTPANLTDDEKLFIIMWGKDSFPLLSYLRLKLNNTEKTNNYLEFYNQNLNNAINKYDNIKIDSILHRRVFNDFFIEDVGKIGIFEIPLSITFDSNSNLEFGDFHITILAPIGTNGAYIEELMHDESYSQHLNEWLFPQKTRYKTLFKDYESKEAIIIILGDEKYEI